MSEPETPDTSETPDAPAPETSRRRPRLGLAAAAVAAIVAVVPIVFALTVSGSGSSAAAGTTLAKDKIFVPVSSPTSGKPTATGSSRGSGGSGGSGNAGSSGGSGGSATSGGSGASGTSGGSGASHSSGTSNGSNASNGSASTSGSSGSGTSGSTGSSGASAGSGSSSSTSGSHVELPPGSGALVADMQHPTQMRSKPASGHVIAHVKLKTSFGSPATFWVTRTSGNWLGVISALAGNNRVGWIPARSAFLTRVDWELRASLAHRELTVLHGGRAVRHFSIAIGRPSAPTPAGRFAVTDRLRTGNPLGPYGCCILALSAQAPHAIEDWSGGDRIAVHSTPETDSIGKPVSHGCMRLSLPAGRWLLAHIPLGTPAIVSSA